MARSQSVQATDDKDTTNIWGTNSIGDLEGSQDEIFDYEVAAEDKDVPDDDAALWTMHFGGGDDESPPAVLHDINLPSVSIWHDSKLPNSNTSSIPQVINVSSDNDDGSSAAINSIMSASTTFTRQSSISASTIHLINNDLRKCLVYKYLKHFKLYTETSWKSRNGMLLGDALNVAYRLSFAYDNDDYTRIVMRSFP